MNEIVPVKMGDDGIGGKVKSGGGFLHAHFAEVAHLNHAASSGEPWLRGWSMEVYLNATVPVANGVTGTNGTASFPNLQAQIYTVCEVPPAGWHTTNPMAINPTYGKPCFTVNLNPGQTISVLFGNSK